MSRLHRPCSVAALAVRAETRVDFMPGPHQADRLAMQEATCMPDIANRMRRLRVAVHTYHLIGAASSAIAIAVATAKMGLIECALGRLRTITG
jgi:hypothetical protein